MRSPEIVIYNHPNPEMKSFLTTVEISAPCVEHFRKPLKKDQEDTLKKQLGVIGTQIVNEIMAIPGIKEMTIKPKEILIKKERPSFWEEIEKPVIEILNRALRKKQIKMIKG
ncbi:MAG: NifU N-terminal domain-containing protein [Deltaproteobacteria bacterium]|nr:NifU N-terminal domain-containing protein [Deltaproteobacteria bacterium]MBW1737381.1 NifU N-terminal domain-containing protein [Deltaproteobacteria bacterium]MBW1909939.1 NifU N-terminal domain-containing protein [Deltaproteobacteria bacterium]MBW2033486.1 NifU N-terminal domain-containing protein [Deltaproteobacteria bacterium]MBW2114619.1 NifU N-terminal domain-containing protein [Deltaproteobacteria bacterium]